MSSSTSELGFSYPNQFIRAGAGAGKTTQLISTFIDFVRKFKEAHRRYPRVILTTFTRKSTQEIKERLLRKALEINDPELFAYMNKKSFVHISTIHGVLGLFLNQHQNEVGLSTDFKVLDKEQIRKNNFKELKSIFKAHNEFVELLEHYSFKDLLQHLDQAFEFLNQHNKIHFIKNSDLINLREKEFRRMIALVETLSELPTPTGKGWAEYFIFLQQISNALKSDNLDLAVELFVDKPKKPMFSKSKPPFDTELHDEMQKYFADEKAILCQLDTNAYIAENHRINELFFNLLQNFSLKIKESRRNRNEITISDLETLSLDIIRNSKTAAKQFSSEYDYFMVDEFQDTSPVQLEILNQLIANKNHFIVGDPQQSIYLFRGARSEVFLSKQAQALKGNYENIRLNTNYRSNPSLMKFMNQFFADFSTAFEPMVPKIETEKNHNSFFNAYYIQTANEAKAAINHIQKLMNQGAKASDICVLSKRNATLMRLSQTADQFNLPVQLMVAAGFDDRREILDLVSFVRFLVNPHDTENLIQLLRSPWFVISDNEIVAFRKESSSNNSLWNHFKISQHLDAQNLLNYQKQYNLDGVLHTTLNFIKSTQMLMACHYLDSSGKKEANIWKFIQNLRDQINHKSFHLNEYLANQFSSLQSDLASNLSEAQPVVTPDRVNLMTIHNAKGLQFEHVIVLGMKDQPNTTNIMPLSKDETSGGINLGIFSDEDSQIQNSYWGQGVRRQFNARELAESERLLYVAVTRAITTVTLIAEDKKRNMTGTWFGKSAWPVIGEYNGPDFSYESIRDDSEPNVLNEQIKKNNQVIDPYQKLGETQQTSESVTDKIAKNKFSESKAISNQFINNLDKAKTGTDLHKFFEALKYNTLDDVLKLTNDKNKSYLSYLLQQSDLPLENILKLGFVEWGFGLKIQTPEGHQFIQGQIDAWGIVDNTIYILDYKTGSSEYVESAYQQLFFYAVCLKSMSKVRPNQKIILGVIYPVEEKVFKKEVNFETLNL